MTASTRQVTGDVHDVLEGVFVSLRELVARTQAIVDAGAPTTGRLASIDPLAQAALAREDGMIVGAGFVAEAGALADAEYWLQWWSDYETPRTWEPRQLLVQTDPHSENFNDYTTLPWFKAPRADGRRHVTGPYVDFLCTDEYTLTFTVPIAGPDGFAGVVGADVYARVMESVVAPLLAEIVEPAALLNASGRVVTVNRSTLAIGDMVRHPAVTGALKEAAAHPPSSPTSEDVDGHHVFVCADMGLAVVTGPAIEG